MSRVDSRGRVVSVGTGAKHRKSRHLERLGGPGDAGVAKRPGEIAKPKQ